MKLGDLKQLHSSTGQQRLFIRSACPDVDLTQELTSGQVLLIQACDLIFKMGTPLESVSEIARFIYSACLRVQDTPTELTVINILDGRYVTVPGQPAVLDIVTDSYLPRVPAPILSVAICLNQLALRIS